MSDFDWYLVQYKPNSHKIAERNLNRQGFSVFLPMQDVTMRKANRFVDQSRPLFPGYLFVQVSTRSAPWRSINGTYGVSRLVSFSNRPTPVPTPFIDGLRRRCDDSGRLQPTTPFQKGDVIEITQGPFAKFIATIDRIDADERIWVLLDLLGQKSRMRTTASSLRAI